MSAEPLPSPERQSGVGIASFIISISAALGIFLGILIATVWQASTPGGIDKQSVGNILLGLFMIALLGTEVIAVGLGITGILQKERKKVFAVVGTIFASATIVGTLFLLLIGLGMKSADPTKDPDVIKGAEAVDRRDGSKAVEAFTSASRKFPQNSAIFLGLGRGYGILQDNDKARQNYEHAVALNPRNADAWMYLGMALYDSEPSKAIEACKKATELKPADASAWLILAKVYESQREFSLAIPALQRAVEIRPDFTEAWSSLGDVYSVTGDYKRSSDARRRAADLKARNGPDNLRNEDQRPPPRNQ